MFTSMKKTRKKGKLMSSPILNVYIPDTKVTIGDGIDGAIISLEITSKCAVRYQVAWWNGQERRTAWMNDDEFVVNEHEVQLAIGFGR